MSSFIARIIVPIQQEQPKVIVASTQVEQPLVMCTATMLMQSMDAQNVK